MNKARTIETFVCIAVLVAVLFVGVWQIKPAHATTIFSDDFEDNTFDAWTSADSNCSIVTTPALCGTYSMFMNATTSGGHTIYKDFSSTYSELYAQMLMRVDSLGGGDYIRRMLYLDAGDGLIAGVGVDYTDALFLQYLNDTEIAQDDSATTINLGATYSLTVHVVQSDTVGAVYVYLNNTEIVDLRQTGLDNIYGEYLMDMVAVGADYAYSAGSKVYIDEVVVADTPFEEDTTGPSFGAITATNTIAGTATQLSCTLGDNVGVSGSIFSWNNTGLWTNQTWASGSSATLSGTWNDTADYVVSARVYGNDTSDNWGASAQYNFTLTTDTTPPTFGTISANTTLAGNVTALSCSILDSSGIDYVIPSWNNTGTWQNQTALDAGDVASYAANFTGIWNTTVGTKVSVKFYGNDTLGNMGVSTQYNFTLTSSSPNGIIISNGTRGNNQWNVAVNATSIQTALDWCSNGGVDSGIVILPSGTFTFISQGTAWDTVEIPLTVNLTGQTDNSTILKIAYNVPDADDPDAPLCWFSHLGNKSPTQNFRFSYIVLIGPRYYNVSNTNMFEGLKIEDTFNFRVDHCIFQDMCSNAIWAGDSNDGTGGGEYVGANDTSCGVVDHCVLNNTYGYPGFLYYESRTLGYGIALRRWACNVWEPLASVWGHYTNYTIFIENCYFSKWRHIACSTDGHIVFRYNVVDKDYGDGSTDGHGSYAEETHPDAVGTRCWEVYNNTFSDPDLTWAKMEWNGYAWALGIRGGSWIAYNNTLTGKWQLLDFNNDWGNYEPYRPDCAVNNTYLWSNTLNGSAIQDPYRIHYNADSLENINYFWRMPTQGQDGITYTPYPYPMYLTGDESPPVFLTITNPQNTTYTSGTISVSLSASGGTIDTIWWNCKNSTTWIYGSNQTYTVPTSMTGFVDGTSYTFYAWANNTLGEWDEETVMFTVLILYPEFGSWWGDWWGIP